MSGVTKVHPRVAFDTLHTVWEHRATRGKTRHQLTSLLSCATHVSPLLEQKSRKNVKLIVLHKQGHSEPPHHILKISV